MNCKLGMILSTLLGLGITAQAGFHILDVESKLFVKYGKSGEIVNPVQILGAADNHDDEIIFSMCHEGKGRLARLYVRFTEKNHRFNGPLIHLPQAGTGVGYIGSQILKASDPVSHSENFVDRAGVFSVPLDTVMWYGVQNGGLRPGEQSCNDLALALRFADADGSGTKTPGDMMEIVGVIYTVGSDTVYGQSADQLTEILSDPQFKNEPAVESKLDEVAVPPVVPESLDTLGFLFAATTR